MTAFRVRTARDLPEGAEVQTFHTTITKHADGWTNAEGDPFTDEEIDRVLARGGMLTRIPTHRRSARVKRIANEMRAAGLLPRQED